MIKHNNYLLVKVPEGMMQFDYTDELFWPRIRYYKNNNQHGHIDINKGNYQIIGLAKDLEADIWDNIFPNRDGGYFLERNNLELSTTLILKEVEK